MGSRRTPPGVLVGARAAAVGALWEVDTRGAYAQVAVERVLSTARLQPRDRALTTELTYGALRRLATLDWAIAQMAGRPVDKLDPWVRNALRVGLFQLMYLDRVPARAACDESVEAAKARAPRAAGLVNAILRRYLREPESVKWPDPDSDPVAYLAVTESHPEWLVRRWLARLGFSETQRLLQANNADPALTLRINSLRTDRAALEQRLGQSGLSLAPTAHAPCGLTVVSGPGPEALGAVAAGLAQVQDESSMLVGLLVDPRPGEAVLDTCSAPGGKATHLAELMRNDGEIVACDVYPEKLRVIAENADRLGISIIDAVEQDARHLARLPEFAGRFDRVLVDAPCSGLGVLGRRADARWRKQPADIEQLAALQLEILHSAARCVRPGGRLVFSTCTTEPEENEENAAKFIATHPEWSVTPAAEVLAARGVKDPASLCSGPYLRTWPHRHGIDGFFGAVFAFDKFVCNR